RGAARGRASPCPGPPPGRALDLCPTPRRPLPDRGLVSGDPRGRMAGARPLGHAICLPGRAARRPGRSAAGLGAGPLRRASARPAHQRRHSPDGRGGAAPGPDRERRAMTRRLGLFGVGLAILALLTCAGLGVPLDFAIALVFGWIFYLA